MSSFDVELIDVIKEFEGRRGDHAVRAVDNISLQIENGEFFALLGPSGCGKTTTLRMIAGFEHPSSGKILIRGNPVQNVPPFHRPVNTVFQDYALFPHMTSLKNVMFGLEMEGVPKREAQKRAMEALEMVQLPGVANRRPREMSGGQQQRVALARALVKNPTVLLLDEPLGALDLKLRKAMQYELKEMQHQLGITFIYLTHDQEEALTMANRIAVMHEGKVLQVGAPRDIYEKPHTRFVADFIGETNFIRGKLHDKDGTRAHVTLSDGLVVGAIMDTPEMPLHQDVTIAIRPEKVMLIPTSGEVRSSTGHKISAETALQALREQKSSIVIPGMIKQSVYIGTDMRHIVTLGNSDTEIVVRLQNFGEQFDTPLSEGQAIHIYWVDENARILRD